MKKTILTALVILACLVGCRDQLSPVPYLGGTYVEEIPVSPGWQYQLDVQSGTYRQWAEFAGTVISEFEQLPWTQVDGKNGDPDTLVLGGPYNTTSPTRRFAIEPWDEQWDVVKLRPLAPPNDDAPFVAFTRVWRRTGP